MNLRSGAGLFGSFPQGIRLVSNDQNPISNDVMVLFSSLVFAWIVFIDEDLTSFPKHHSKTCNGGNRQEHHISVEDNAARRQQTCSVDADSHGMLCQCQDPVNHCVHSGFGCRLTSQVSSGTLTDSLSRLRCCQATAQLSTVSFQVFGV